MKRDSVTYRLGIEGDQAIVATLAKIGEAGEGSAKRMASAYQRDLRVAEASVERLQKRAEALQVLGGSALQRRIAESTGLAAGELGNTKSAEASMRAFVEQQDRLARSRDRLIAQADPLFAAQQRYNQVMAEAVRLDRQGALAKGDLSTIHANAKAELQAYSQAMGGATKNANLQRMGFQQLSYQVADVGASYASGINPMVIFAQQGTQVVQSVALMSSGTSKLASFLTGPWGLAVMGGVSVLGILGASMLRARDSSEDLEGALDFQKLTHEQLVKAIDQQREAMEQSIEVSAAAELRARDDAAANLDAAMAVRERIKAELDLQAAREFDGTNASGVEGGVASTAAQAYRVGGLEQRIAEQDRAIAGLRDILAGRQFAVSKSEAAALTDPQARIRRVYELAEDKLQKQAQQERWSAEKTTAALTALEKARKAEVELLEKQEREARNRDKPSGGSKGNIGDMVALLEQLFPGVRITSTTGGKHTEGSDHYKARAIDFVPAGGMGSVSTEQVYEALRAAGVDIRRNANGTEQFFGPGRSANRRGDHDDHFHLAWSGSVPDTYRLRLEAEKELERQIERNTQSVRSLIEAGDPYAAIANRLGDELAEIDRLAGIDPAKGGIGSEQAEILRRKARGRADEARKGVFDDAFDKEFGESAKARERRGEFIQREKAGQARDGAMLDRELQLVRATARERERELQMLAYSQALKAEGLRETDAEYKALMRGNAALLDREAMLEDLERKWDEQTRLGMKFIDMVLDPEAWDNWGDLGKRVLRELMRDFLRLALLNPLKNKLFGTDLPTLGGVFGKGDAPPGNAIGDEYSSGGLRRVGEFGEELVQLPRGSRVVNASRTRALDPAQPRFAPAKISIYAPGADAAQLRRVEDRLQELNESIERRAIDATVDANARTFGQLYSV